MTSLASGDETGNVFSSVGVNSGLTEAQYKTLAEYPFNVAVRTAADDMGGDFETPGTPTDVVYSEPYRLPEGIVVIPKE